MAIDLNAAKSVGKPVSNDELQSVMNDYALENKKPRKKSSGRDDKQLKKKPPKEKKIDDKAVVMAVENNSQQVKKRRKQAQLQKQRADETREKTLQNVRVRKYTKEMQSRDAIVEASRKMRADTSKTKSVLDDKFADAAYAPSRKFDDLIYNSQTAGDVEEKMDDITEDVVEAAKQYS